MNRILSLLPSVLCAPLLAQGLLLGPVPDPDRTQNPPVRAVSGQRSVHIVRTAVNAAIVDGVATTTIDQLFRNDGGRDAEGTWFMPLPAGAVADGFTMTVGGKEVAGEVLDANQARGVYESIVRQRRDPGLLEYAGEGLLRARIFPIPAHGEVGVTVRLRQVLQPTGGLYEWVWPLRSAHLGDAAVGPIGLELRIKSRTALSTILTPHGFAEIRRTGDHEATVSLEGQVGQMEDLRVLYGLAEQEFGLHMLPYRAASEPGYFTMLVSPPRKLADKAQPRRCVQFVVDTSGSMAGDKIEQAKAALRTFVHSLRPTDLFQVVTFASGVQTFFARPELATSENIAAALQRVDRLTAMGGTDIAGALQQALEAVPPAGEDGAALLPQIVFVTDGQPTVGVTNPQQILDLTKQLDRRATRIFALGVGDEIDVRLIDDLVQQHRGARDFVRNKEKIEVKVDALCQKIAQPALTDVEIRCEGLDAFDVHPSSTRDLFCGEMMQVVGRYRDAGRRTVRVRGRQNGVEREYAFEVEFPAAAEQHAFVPTLWARQHVATLMDAIRRNGARAELIGEVKRLATRYGIVTPYTSQLIVEEGVRLAGQDERFRERERDRRNRVPGSAGPSGPSTGAPTPSSPAPELKDLGKARTGEQAIAESLVTSSDDLYLGARRLAPGADAPTAARSQALLRRAAGRVFVIAGDDLVEQGLPTDWLQQAVAVEAYSKAYFELLRANPKLREVLALGDRIAFRDGSRIVHVKPAAKAEPANDGVVPPPAK